MSIDAMTREWLPLNRKERYYTGTVLPQIICADDFAYFGRFLNLIGLKSRPLRTAPSDTNIQFFTEYNLVESLYYDGSNKKFPKLPKASYTPDVLIMLGEPEPALILIEAKMFTSPQPRELVKQISYQKEHVARYLEEHLGPFASCTVVALLPSSYVEKVETSGADLSGIRILRWQDVFDTFRDVSSARYFLGTLEVALSRHHELRSVKPAGDANSDGWMLGGEIVASFVADGLAFRTMGRQGGIRGVVDEDLPLGRWKSHSYQVSFSETPANRNWFEIAQFVRLVRDPGAV